LLADGKVIGWGGDGSGRLPPAAPQYCTSPAPSRPVEVLGEHRFVGIAAGRGVSLAITATRHIVVWGATVAGIGVRLSSVALATPQLLEGIDRVRAVAAGELVFGAIDSAGKCTAGD
jgi:alpha-tubulin suppressor-like RCC1 family protein